MEERFVDKMHLQKKKKKKKKKKKQKKKKNKKKKSFIEMHGFCSWTSNWHTN